MPRKTKIIFITVFIVVGAIVLGIVFGRSSSTNKNNTTSGGYKLFNPFGSGTTSNSGNGGEGEQVVGTPTQNPDGTPYVSRFHRITDFAIAGATSFEDSRVVKDTATPQTTNGEVSVDPITGLPIATKPTANKASATPTPKVEPVPAIRYVERATGHIYEMYTDSKLIGKISNATIPSIYESYFNNTADTVIYRYLASDNQTITSYIATLGGSKGEFLPNNIVDVSVSPDMSKFFYLVKNSRGVVGSIRIFKDTKSNPIFTSPYTEWLSQWINPNTIYLTTKAASGVEGNMFALNTNTGTLSKVLGDISGLTTLGNASGTSVLYSISETKGPHLYIFTTSTHTTNDTGFYTLPEKCVWNISGTVFYCAVPNNITASTYPDSWYQGLVSFDDQFISYDTTTNNTHLIADSANETPIDATHLFINKNENSLYFTNKKDSTLWSLDIK